MFILGFVKKKKLYKEMEIFHQCLKYTPSNLSDFILKLTFPDGKSSRFLMLTFLK